MRHLLEKPYTIFLETTKRDSENQKTLLFQEPEHIIQANTLLEVKSALEQMEDARCTRS